LCLRAKGKFSFEIKFCITISRRRRAVYFGGVPGARNVFARARAPVLHLVPRGGARTPPPPPPPSPSSLCGAPFGRELFSALVLKFILPGIHYTAARSRPTEGSYCQTALRALSPRQDPITAFPRGRTVCLLSRGT